MNQRYENRKEYSLMDVLKYNLRKWWLAVIFAVVCAVLVGGYKAKTLMPYINAQSYDEKTQVNASVLLKDYSSGSNVERGNNLMRIAKSSKVYDEFRKVTGIDLTKQAFTDMIESEQVDSSDIINFHLVYPKTSWDYTVNDETEALNFMNGMLKALDNVTKKQIGTQCFIVFDGPTAESNIEKYATYTITESQFRQAVLKAATAGILLGILLEVICYTLWMMLYKKPKDIQEVQECLGTQIVDVITKKSEEETYKKAALFLGGSNGEECQKINCLSVGMAADVTASRLAMCYANEKKKTLFIDLNAGDSEEASLSAYVMGDTEELKLQQMNDYLDTVKRNIKQEKGFDLVGNERFKELIERFSKQYAYIIINGRDAGKMSEAYQTAVLCDRNLVVCSRRNTRMEDLYMIKNTAEINHIHLDGVLVYDL